MYYARQGSRYFRIVILEFRLPINSKISFAEATEDNFMPCLINSNSFGA